jgi:hypothetical protein
MSDDANDRTTMTAPPRVRDRAKALRTVEEEPLWKVLDRALDALEVGDRLDADDAGATTDSLAERIDALDTVDYDDLVAANRQALREELPDGVFRDA